MLSRTAGRTPTRLTEHIIEIISDSGEGAQKCGQSLGSIAAQMGNGIWTTEIIPAEIRPPARSVAGASGNRIRIGSGRVSNGGDETDLVVAFNEQVLLGRVSAGELQRDAAARSLRFSWGRRKHASTVSLGVLELDELTSGVALPDEEGPLAQSHIKKATVVLPPEGPLTGIFELPMFTLIAS